MQGLDLPRTKPGLPMTPPLPEISSQPTTVSAITSQTLPDQVKTLRRQAVTEKAKNNVF